MYARMGLGIQNLDSELETSKDRLRSFLGGRPGRYRELENREIDPFGYHSGPFTDIDDDGSIWIGTAEGWTPATEDDCAEMLSLARSPARRERS